jgi:hypothetical protein
MPIKDPEKRREQARRWQEANRDRVRAARRAWKSANPDKHRANAQRYYQKNRAAIQERRRRRKLADPEAAKRRLREYRKARPHIFRNHWLRNQYGIEQPQWDALFDRQGRCCAICKTTDPGGAKGWHTDHDHDTHKVRGILCRSCNTGLGTFKEDPDLFASALKYLRRNLRGNE